MITVRWDLSKLKSQEENFFTLGLTHWVSRLRSRAVHARFRTFTTVNRAVHARNSPADSRNRRGARSSQSTTPRKYAPHAGPLHGTVLWASPCLGAGARAASLKMRYSARSGASFARSGRTPTVLQEKCGVRRSRRVARSANQTGLADTFCLSRLIMDARARRSP